MDAKWKALWLTDLRSGEFEQGHVRLRTISPGPILHPFSYCCLGVLAERYRRETEEGTWSVQSFIIPYPHLSPEEDARLGLSPEARSNRPAGESEYEGAILPVAIAAAVDLPISTQCQLAAMNDGQGKEGEPVPSLSFTEIADWIQANL